MHELLHHDPNLDPYFIENCTPPADPIWEKITNPHGFKKGSEKVEDEIERVAFEIYETRPLLVNYLISRFKLYS